jgi:hypothetical protein
MTSAPTRDPIADHLLTPQNTAFLLIDYQPQQLVAVRSMDRRHRPPGEGAITLRPTRW